MEALISSLQSFSEWLMRATLQASLLIVLILAIQTILGRRLGIRWRYCLWLLLLVRMALPWAPQSRISMFNLIPHAGQKTPVEHASEEVAVDSINSGPLQMPSVQQPPAVTNEVVEAAPQPVAVIPSAQRQAETELEPPPVLQRSADLPRASFEIANALLLVWLAGVAVLAGCVCAGNISLWRIIKRERCLTDQRILELVEDCKSQMGVQTVLGVVATDKVKSPALFGFVRPRLLLPKKMVEELGFDELRHVFLHELAHLRRHDIFVGYLVSILQILHWFNPLVWLAFSRLRADRELACDALALSTMESGESKEYGRTVVHLLENFLHRRRLPSLAGISEDKSQIRRRITSIARFKKKSYRWSPLAIVLFVILGCVSLPDAKRMKASEASGPESSPGITLRQVWSGPDVDPHVAASPDGRYLSYVDWTTGDLAIREIATGKTRRLTSKGDLETARLFALYSVISPDSRLVAYSWSNEYGTLSLCLVGIDGSADRTLYASEYHVVFPVCWSSDSKQVAAKRHRKGNLEIILVSVEQGSIEVLKTCEKPPLWDEFCYSPDNRFVAYDFPAADDSGNYDIGIFDTKDKSEMSLIEHPANDRLLGWLPARDEILFLSDRAGSQDVWAMKIADGKAVGSPRPVMRDIGQITPQGLTHDGSFYFGRYTRRFTTHIVPFDTKTGEIQAESKTPLLGSNFYPEWSPDGESLAYVTEEEDKRRLHIRNLKTGEERELAGNIGIRSPRWSPDGRFILAPGFDNSKGGEKDYRGGLYTIDVKKDQATELVPFPPRQKGWAGSTAEWALDGNAVFYLTPNGIVKRDLDSGQEKQIYQCDSLSRALSLSPDGKRLAFCIELAGQGQGQVMSISVLGGQPTKLCSLQETTDGFRVPKQLAWTPDGNYILFVKKEKKGSTLWRVASQGGVPQMILESSDLVHSLCVHPHGKRIAYSTGIQEGSVWAMESFLPEAPIAKPVRELNIRRVWAEAADPYFMGAASPNGQYLSYVDWENGNLAIRELATGKSRRLTNEGWGKGRPTYSIFSPDSKYVACRWRAREGGGLHIIGVDGSKQRFIEHPEGITILRPAGWSTDGKHILTLGGAMWDDSNKAFKFLKILFVSIEDGDVHVLKTIEPLPDLKRSGRFRMSLSPDGRYVAYSFPPADNSGKGDIWVFGTKRGPEIQLVEHPADDFVLAWSPDGNRLVFASDRAGTMGVWAIEVAEGRAQGSPKLLKAEIGRFHPLGFTQNGSYYYGTYYGGSNIYTAAFDPEKGDLSAEPVIAVRRNEGSNWAPDWSPDGRYLACLSSGPGMAPRIVIQCMETGEV
ncbi:MAG: M56 family metallopeptidase, partial [Planctomycetota bacterium]